jgi:bidirectional [NiFe] hydrogenase diaphorase subunit
MTPEELRQSAEAERQKSHACKHILGVCCAAGCQSMGSDKIKDALDKQVRLKGMESEVNVKSVGCLGLCAAGPLVSLESSGKKAMYQGVKEADVAEVVEKLGKAPVKRLELPLDIPFFARQQKIVLENSGVIDPERIEEYFAAGGYEALIKALTDLEAAEVIDTVSRSGLRGRGGAGFPTGLKWATVAKAAGSQKYIVCNADEGDPGAFMNRSVLESDPHRVIEGMIIAGYAVGATQGFVYVRAEYPLAIKRLKTAIKQAEGKGLLGDKILGTTFSFRLEIRLGAGAFVCGEETALLISIEGSRGMPRPRPPFPAESGLWGKPTLINNVETFSTIPAILRNGWEWYSAIGTEKSKGTKVFALAGQIKNTGLIEVPMGTKLRDIIFDIGGGVPDGKKFKAVQTGGPSGGCIPESKLDMSVDYESLREAGSIMGSGGMIVMNEDSSMVDVAKFFTEFCMSESCGKCVPCRAGTAQMFGLLEKIHAGEAVKSDLELLKELCDLVRTTSLCGLGQTAPNPVMSTLQYFEKEYTSLLKDGPGKPAAAR